MPVDGNVFTRKNLWLICFLWSCIGTVPTVCAEQLDIAVGWTKPPYVIAKDDSGFELELVSAVLSRLGDHPRFIYVPYGRSHGLLKNRKVDVALTLNTRVGVPENQLSDVYVVYQNVAISLKNKNISLATVEDLAMYTIAGFQNSSVVLGPAYKAVSEQSPLYIEIPEQRRQVEMLLMGNVAIAVMDINIFVYLSRELSGESQLDQVDVHYLFPPSPYRAGFSDLQLKKQFNTALSDYLSSDEYLILKQKYEFQQLPQQR